MTEQKMNDLVDWLDTLRAKVESDVLLRLPKTPGSTSAIASVYVNLEDLAEEAKRILFDTLWDAAVSTEEVQNAK